MKSSTILISLLISALITFASAVLEYILAPKRSLLVPDGVELPQQVEVSYYDPACDYPAQAVAKRQQCEFCKTMQGVGEHCLNCGAPLE